jgi:hypothetical protein
MFLDATVVQHNTAVVLLFGWALVRAQGAFHSSILHSDYRPMQNSHCIASLSSEKGGRKKGRKESVTKKLF